MRYQDCRTQNRTGALFFSKARAKSFFSFLLKVLKIFLQNRRACLHTHTNTNTFFSFPPLIYFQFFIFIGSSLSLRHRTEQELSFSRHFYAMYLFSIFLFFLPFFRHRTEQELSFSCHFSATYLFSVFYIHRLLPLILNKLLQLFYFFVVLLL